MDNAGVHHMPTTFASLGLEELELDEKLEVVGQLWEDLVTSISPGRLLTKAQQEELSRRLEDAAARPNDWIAMNRPSTRK